MVRSDLIVNTIEPAKFDDKKCARSVNAIKLTKLQITFNLESGFGY